MLRSMEIKVPLPIKDQVDNVGAIWLANNSSVSERTKHVDLGAHCVRDMIKDQVIELNFVKSTENDSDIMTKINSDNITCMQSLSWCIQCKK